MSQSTALYPNCAVGYPIKETDNEVIDPKMGL